MKMGGRRGKGVGKEFSTGGFSLVEGMVAAIIVIMGVTSVYMVSSQCMQIAASSHNSTLANQILQEQTERLKAASFPTLLTSGSLSSFLTANPLTSGSNLTSLKGLTNTVKISGYLLSGSSSTSGTISVRSTISANGAASVATVTSGTLNSTTVQAQVTLNWTERSGNHSRSSTTFITKYE